MGVSHSHQNQPICSHHTDATLSARSTVTLLRVSGNVAGNANAGRAACGSAADDAGCAAADARTLGSKNPVAARGRLGC
eukprot:2817639-Prymnesium_polylepis.1